MSTSTAWRFRSSRRPAVKIYHCAAAAAALLVAGAYSSAQTQLLLDPGFEAGVDGSPNTSNGDAQTTAGPWTSWNNWAPPYLNGGYYTSSIPAHSGTQVGKTYSGPNAGFYQYANVTPYDAYTASAWFVNSGSDPMQPGETDDVRLAQFLSGPNGTGTQTGGVVISAATVSSSTASNQWTQLQVQAAAPAGSASVQWMAFFNNPGYFGGSMFVDDASLIDTSWNGGGTSNNWSDNNNWGGIAPGQYAPVVFAGTTQLNNNNDTPAGTPYYGIAFTPTAGSYTLTGNQANLASNVNNYSANAQTIALPLGIQQNTNINAQGGNITISGAIGGAFAVTINGSHTVTLSGANTYSGGTNVTAGTLVVGASGAIPANTPVSITGGTMQLGASTGAQTISSLAISGTGTLDVNNNHLFIDYAGGADPISSIAALLATGYDAGKWDGAGGIVTSAPLVVGGLTYGIGYADGADPQSVATGLSSGTIEIKYTLLGDADLNGIVNGIDFGILAANFNKGITGWDEGDFDYNNIVNGLDFGDLAANFNKGAAGTDAVAALDAFAAANGLLADVPEPASAALLLLGATSLLSRRKRQRLGGSV